MLPGDCRMAVNSSSSFNSPEYLQCPDRDFDAKSLRATGSVLSRLMSATLACDSAVTISETGEDLKCTSLSLSWLEWM